MKEISYNRKKVLEYAQKWAYDRNPRYYNFDSIGGDCTSFASQCIFAGSNVMNYSKSNKRVDLVCTNIFRKITCKINKSLLKQINKKYIKTYNITKG